MYDFSIPGYDRAPEINYGWFDPPADTGTAWLGLADWTRDRWVWYRCRTDGRTGIASIEPYIDGSGRLVAVFVLANAETSRLRWVHVGPPQVEAVLEVSPNAGLPPLAVTCSAAKTTTAAGVIENHDWDWDGDGVYRCHGQCIS